MQPNKTTKLKQKQKGEKVTLVSEQVRKILLSFGHEVRFLAARPDVRELAGHLTKDDSDLHLQSVRIIGWNQST